jgi:hypothetical protein
MEFVALRPILKGMPVKRVRHCVGARQLGAARAIAEREGVSLSTVFLRGLERELEAVERRSALEEFLRDVPPLSPKRKSAIRARWERKTERI